MYFLPTVEIRAANAADADALARVWHAGWQDAHGTLVPATLAPHRTLDFFRAEIDRHIPNALVLATCETVVGFSAIEGEELSHFFLASDVRGRGVARRLLARTEDALLAAGVDRPFLLCAVGNVRARRFYERMGWDGAAAVAHLVATPDGPVTLEALRMTKDLRATRDDGGTGRGESR